MPILHFFFETSPSCISNRNEIGPMRNKTAAHPKPTSSDSPSIRPHTHSPYLPLRPAQPPPSPSPSPSPSPAALWPAAPLIPRARPDAIDGKNYETHGWFSPWRRPRPWRRCCAASGATAPPPLARYPTAASSHPLPLWRPHRPRWALSACQACSRETAAEAASPLRSAPTRGPGFLGGTMRLLRLPGRRTKLLRGRRVIPPQSPVTSFFSSPEMLVLACDCLTKLPFSCSPESPAVAAASSEASSSTAASQSEIVDFIKSALGKLEGKYVTFMHSVLVFST
jgi:hypothetical protein